MRPTGENVQMLKGALFAKCFGRAKRAIEDGYYLEAISLSESMIMNRLSVVLNANLEDDFSKFSVGKSANNLISHKVPAFDINLWRDCLEWSKERNKISHKFADLDFIEQQTLDWRAKLNGAKLVAVEGLSLANRCSNEARKHKL